MAPLREAVQGVRNQVRYRAHARTLRLISCAHGGPPAFRLSLPKLDGGDKMGWWNSGDLKQFKLKSC